jgi:hypothetical protein
MVGARRSARSLAVPIVADGIARSPAAPDKVAMTAPDLVAPAGEIALAMLAGLPKA